MLIHPNIDPIAFSIGPFSVRWYGLMYLVGFVGGLLLMRYRAKNNPRWTTEECDDVMFYTAMGLLIGARMGYMLFYQWAAWLQDPLALLRVWEGGMSFHGGLLGVLVAWLLLAKKQNKHLFDISDYALPAVPIGLGAGRIGNFINSELWGKVTDVPWAIAPYPGAEPRHPTQLYEFLLEGVLLFIILWLYSAKRRPTMAVTGLFLVCYGVFRFSVEFVRLPDAHIGYIAFGWLTMGQLLTLPMIIAGTVMLVMAYRCHFFQTKLTRPDKETA